MKCRIWATSPWPSPRATPCGPDQARYLPQIAQTCKRLGDMVDQAVERWQATAGTGGDHSVAIGTVAGIVAAFQQRNEKIGLIWIDAHADMNTPETSAQRKRARHAARLLHRPGSARADDICSTSLPRSNRAMSRSWVFAMWTVSEVPHVRDAGRDRLHHARHRRARAASRDARSHRTRDSTAPPAFISPSTWMWSIREKPRASARPFAAA